jgi:hypothetical protein
MIWESQYWKDELLAIARRLNRRRWTTAGELMLVRTEQDVMIGFYIVRKLIEAKKITNELAERSVDIISHPCIRPPVTLMNWHKIDELYDLNTLQRERIQLSQLANTFIHSYVFITDADDRGCLSGIYVNSDHSRNRKIYYLPIKDIIHILKEFGSNYPHMTRRTRNPQTGEVDVYNA